MQVSSPGLTGLAAAANGTVPSGGPAGRDRWRVETLTVNFGAQKQALCARYSGCCPLLNTCKNKICVMSVSFRKLTRLFWGLFPSKPPAIHIQERVRILPQDEVRGWHRSERSEPGPVSVFPHPALLCA